MRRDSPLDLLRDNPAYTYSVLAVVVLCLAIFGFIKSGLSHAKYDDVVLVAGNTQNSPLPVLQDKDASIVDNYVSANAALPKIISATGDPQTINYNARTINKTVAGVNQILSGQPNNNGADYLDAIEIAARNTDEDAKHSAIIVIGSGLSDTGALNFASNDYLTNNVQPEDIAKQLEQQNDIKQDTLDGITVIMSGTGFTSAPQKSLSQKDVDRVDDIWEAVLDDMGAKAVIFDNYTPSGKSVATPFTVNTVYADDFSTPKTIDLNENIARFAPNTADILNDTEVKSYLSGYAQKINQDPKAVVEITGYQTSAATSNQLSLERANVIKSIIGSLGVSGGRITVQGVAGPPNDGKDDGCATGTCNDYQYAHRTVKVVIRDEQ